jgi:hypothetical protein
MDVTVAAFHLHPDLLHTHQAVVHLPLEIFIPVVAIIVIYFIVKALRHKEPEARPQATTQEDLRNMLKKKESQ